MALGFVKIPLLLDRFCIEKSKKKKKKFFFVFYKRIRIEERIRNYIFKVRCIGSSCDDIDLPNTNKVLTYSFVITIRDSKGEYWKCTKSVF